MLSSSKRWIQEQPNKSVTLRCLCSKRRYVILLLIMLVAGIAIRNVFEREDRFPVISRKMFPILQNVWLGPISDSSMMEKDDTRSQLIESTDLDGGKSIDSKDELQIKGEVKVEVQPEVITETNCHPKKHIVFLKTHKTASTTIQNILYRYGESRNLTFAFPLNRDNHFSYPSFFSTKFVQKPTGKGKPKFDIVCNNMRFTKIEVKKWMPGDTFYFSIIRNPVAMMESGFSYFKQKTAFGRVRSLDTFLDFNLKNPTSSMINNELAHNNLAFDFGYDNTLTSESKDLEEKAAEVIEAIEMEFRIILIADYFDESMILLKDSLCWSLEDVVSLRLNSRSEESRRPVSPKTAEKIQSWNALDWKIYHYFNRTFWFQINNLVGRVRMQKEVAQLREMRDELTRKCLKEGHAVNPSQIKDGRLKPPQYGSAPIQGYNINPDLDEETKTICLNNVLPEMQYMARLYNKQFPEKPKK